ncbi:MAG: hypothetical protein ABRQ23_05205 [Syntrophomonadaceae bacterium]
MEKMNFGPTQAELNTVNEVFIDTLKPWWDELQVYIPPMAGEMSYRAIPALVINAYHYLGLSRELGINMANMFKTIYFATRIHEMIGDDEEGQEHTQELQFTILIGDYIFGRVLQLLLETNTEQLLDMFAAMICEINEGLIVKYKSARSLEEILTVTRAPFYSYAFRSAAQLKGFGAEYGEAYGTLGYNLGMALELLAAGQLTEAADYLLMARAWLDGQNDQALPGRNDAMELILEIQRDLRR